jgi:hypothetical protein
MPPPTNDANKLIYDWVAGLGIFLNDYIATIIMGGSATYSRALVRPYRGIFDEFIVKKISDHFHNGVIYAETKEKEVFEINANRAHPELPPERTGVAKFSFLGIRHGLYRDENGYAGRKVGFEIRGSPPNDIPATASAISAAIESFDTTAPDAAKIKAPKWRAFKIVDILTNQAASRKVGDNAFAEFAKRIVGANAALKAPFEAAAAELVVFSNKFLAYRCPGECALGGDATAKACSKGEFPWTLHADRNTCGRHAKNILARATQCLSSGLEKLAGRAAWGAPQETLFVKTMANLVIAGQKRVTKVHNEQVSPAKPILVPLYQFVAYPLCQALNAVMVAK